jgi:hypothetical protein
MYHSLLSIKRFVDGSGAEGHDGFNSINLNYYPIGMQMMNFDGLNQSIRIVLLSSVLVVIMPLVDMTESDYSK